MPELLRLFVHGACWRVFADCDAPIGDRRAFNRAASRELWRLADAAKLTRGQIESAWEGRRIAPSAAARLRAVLGVDDA